MRDMNKWALRGMMDQYNDERDQYPGFFYYLLQAFNNDCDSIAQFLGTTSPFNPYDYWAYDGSGKVFLVGDLPGFDFSVKELEISGQDSESSIFRSEIETSEFSVAKQGEPVVTIPASVLIEFTDKFTDIGIVFGERTYIEYRGDVERQWEEAERVIGDYLSQAHEADIASWEPHSKASEPPVNTEQASVQPEYQSDTERLVAAQGLVQESFNQRLEYIEHVLREYGEIHVQSAGIVKEISERVVALQDRAGRLEETSADQDTTLLSHEEGLEIYGEKIAALEQKIAGSLRGKSSISIEGITKDFIHNIEDIVDKYVEKNK